MKTEGSGKEQALQGIQQALYILFAFVDLFIQFSIAEPDLWVLLIQFRGSLDKLVPRCADIAFRKIVVGYNPLNTCTLPRFES
jgi:hypothetical protein